MRRNPETLIIGHRKEIFYFVSFDRGRLDHWKLTGASSCRYWDMSNFADPWDRQRFVLSSKSFFFVRPPLPLPRCRQHFQRFRSKEFFFSLHLFFLKVIAWKPFGARIRRVNWLVMSLLSQAVPSNWNGTIIPFIFNLRASPSWFEHVLPRPVHLTMFIIVITISRRHNYAQASKTNEQLQMSKINLVDNAPRELCH